MRTVNTIGTGTRLSAPVVVLAIMLISAAAPMAADDAASGGSGDGREATRPEAIRVYTNEDLEKLPPLPPASQPLLREEGDWSFVLLMLDREREIQEKDRAERLERDRLALAEEELERRTSYRLAYPAWYPWGSGRRPFFPGVEPFKPIVDPNHHGGNPGGGPGAHGHGDPKGPEPSPPSEAPDPARPRAEAPSATAPIGGSRP